MGRQKKSKRKNKESLIENLRKEITGIVIIAISSILGLSIIYVNETAALLGPLKTMMEYLFGWFALVVPILTIVYAVKVLNDEDAEFKYGDGFLMLGILAVIASFPALQCVANFTAAVSVGGVFGASIAWALFHSTGTIGGYIVLVAASALIFVFLTRKSFIGIVRKGVRNAKESAIQTREKIEYAVASNREEEQNVNYNEGEKEPVRDNRKGNFDIKIVEDDNEYDYEDDGEFNEEEPDSTDLFDHEYEDQDDYDDYDEYSAYDENGGLIQMFGIEEEEEKLKKFKDVKNSELIDITFWEEGNIYSNGRREMASSGRRVSGSDVYEEDYPRDKFNIDLRDDYKKSKDEQEDDEDYEDYDYEYSDDYEDYGDTSRLPDSLYVGKQIEFDDDNYEEVRDIAEYRNDMEIKPLNISRDRRPKVIMPHEHADYVRLNDYDESEMQEIFEEPEAEYVFPDIKLLNKPPVTKNTNSRASLKKNADILEGTLQSFGVNAKVINVTKGPAVTRYEIQPERGVKVSKIVNLADDIALNLAASGVRMEAPIPGKAAVGIEIANQESTNVLMREVLDTDEFNDAKSKLSVCLGKGIDGNPAVIDLAKMPHLLIAGATGSGKSVCVNSIITSIIYKAKPDEVKLLMIDPKVVELKMYTGIPHLLIPVVTEPKKAASALAWAVSEMLERYKFFAENNVKDLKGYNDLMERSGKKKLPQIVIIIDELADLMMSTPKEVEDAICRLAQMARAAGMHIIIATQRPSVDVITGLIKANIPSRIAFAVSSAVDSRTIIDQGGAEKLLGRGDMLYYPTGASKPSRIQGAFVSEEEVEKVVAFVKKNSNVTYSEQMIAEITTKNAKAETNQEAEDEEDTLIDEAIALVRDRQKASISMFQRAFRIGYNRAARLMEELEYRDVVGPEEGTKPRRVLIDKIDL